MRDVPDNDYGVFCVSGFEDRYLIASMNNELYWGADAEWVTEASVVPAGLTDEDGRDPRYRWLSFIRNRTMSSAFSLRRASG